MANNSPNLKVNIGADTSQFTAGVKNARRELKDFERVSGEALGAVGDSIGVNTGKLEQMASAARGLGTRMTESGNESVRALGSILTKVNAVTTAVAGLGIGAAVAAFKLLNDEATAFKSTIEGANLEMMTSAYVSVYTQTLHDINKATGQATAETAEQMKRGFKGVVESAKSALRTVMTGGAPSLIGAIAQQLPASFIAGQQGEKAAQIANEIYQLERQISDESVKQAKLDAQIAEYKRIAYDSSESTATQAEALAMASQLIKEKYEGPTGLIALHGQLAARMGELVGLAGSGPEEIDAWNQQLVKSQSMVRQMEEELRALSRRQTAVTNAAEKEAQARAKSAAEAAALAKAMEDSRAAMAALDLSVSGDLAGLVPGQLDSAVKGLEIPVKPVLDDQAVLDFTKELAGLAESLSMAIGGLVGDLVTGGDAWGNFRNAALSAFADMAIAVGKLAVATGMTAEGIKAALKLDNPYAAIAAGLGLMALGAAVKAGLANVAAGNYSATASVASSGYGSQRSPEAGGYTLREMTVNVTGTLKGDGDQLIAVIDQTKKRNSYTK